MTDRRTEIINTAIELIVDQGYAYLTMRALARDVGMKLGSLQYHFKTTDELMRAVVNHIGDSYDRSFSAFRDRNEVITVRQLAGFILEDEGAVAAGAMDCGLSPDADYAFSGCCLHNEALWMQRQQQLLTQRLKIRLMEVRMRNLSMAFFMWRDEVAESRPGFRYICHGR